MSELTDLVEKQEKETYELGKKHGAIEEIEKLKSELCHTKVGSHYLHKNSREYGIVMTVKDVFYVLDKHLSNLKGE